MCWIRDPRSEEKKKSSGSRIVFKGRIKGTGSQIPGTGSERQFLFTQDGVTS
jgi:hypothetical protein